MKKSLPLILSLLITSLIIKAQRDNPLINSGEEIKNGISLYDSGKYKDAIEIYSRVTESDTNYVWSRYELALTCIADSEYKRGLAYCEEAISLPGERERLPALFNIKGLLLGHLGRQDEALKLYDSVLVTYPAYSQFYINKGNILYTQGRYGEAEEVFKKGLLINPYSSLLHYNLGVTAVKVGNPVGAALSLITYLLMEPQGDYTTSSINTLNSIALATDEIMTAVEKRKKDIPESLKTTEDILLSKIALEKEYKSLIKIDDKIFRQMQVILEKLEFDNSETDFFMQYYVPYFRQVFTQNEFEVMVNYAFSGVKLEQIQKFNKQNKNEIQHFIDELVVYFNHIKGTRELSYEKRLHSNKLYYFKGAGLSSYGTMNKDTPIGSWVFYYPEGNIRSQGSYNNQGKTHGTWNYYYFNGKIKGTETYEDGKETGEEKYYYDNGMPSYTAQYFDGELNGIKKSFYRNGGISSVENFKNGKNDGLFENYYPSGLLKSKASYKDGNFDGAFTTYHKNGKVEKMGSYISGELSGSYKSFYNTGVLEIETRYDKGNIVDEVKYYYQNGKLKTVEPYQNGKLDGVYIQYHPNGNKSYSYSPKNGSYTGSIDYLDSNGIRYASKIFENDVLTAARFYNKEGKEISSSLKTKGDYEMVNYDEDNLKQSAVRYNEKGNQSGLTEIFYKTGKIKETDTYDDGALTGKVSYYALNGNLNYTLNFNAGKKDGYVVNYYDHGVKKSEGWYIQDLAQGTWKYYDAENNLTSKSNFLNDELSGTQDDYWPNGKLQSHSIYLHDGLVEYIQFDTLGHAINHLKLTNGSGKYLKLYPNGKVHEEGTYVNGSLNGKLQSNYFDGTLKMLSFYKDGLIDSIYRTYFYNGKLLTQGQYSMGEKTGTWQTYDINGKLVYTELFVNGLQEGTSTHFYGNGQIQSTSEYVNDERNGKLIQYDEDGSLIYVLRMVDGTAVGYSYQDKNNKLVPELMIPAAGARIKTFYANGNPSAEFEFVEGKLNGTSNLYHSNGKLKKRTTFNYGSQEGPALFFNEKGILVEEDHYLHNNLHGPSKEFNEKGTLVNLENYYSDSLHGTCILYDDNGKIKNRLYYYYGDLLSIEK